DHAAQALAHGRQLCDERTLRWLARRGLPSQSPRRRDLRVSAEQEGPAREAAADVRGQSAGVHRRAGGWVGDRRHAPHSGPAARRAAPAHAAVHRLEERRGPRVASAREKLRTGRRLTDKPKDPLRHTPSGLPIAPVYRPDDGATDYEKDLGDPGAFPFTRGVQPTMYRGRLWT